MRIFPEKLLGIELERDFSESYEFLKNETEHTHNLISQRTSKLYRGTVTERGFKVISSVIGTGAVCVFIGAFDGKGGTIKIRINTGFKILFGILLAYPLIGFGLIYFDQGLDEAIQSIPILLIGVLFIRFVVIGLSYRFISTSGLSKLTETLQIKSIRNEA